MKMKSVKRPSLSVIIPFFNTGKMLEGLIKQVLKTAPEDAEIICIDDKSTDGSLKRIKKLAEKEPRLMVLTQKQNSGSAAARNRGLVEARGEFICFLDSDDFISDDFFDKMLHMIKKEKAAIGVCGIRQIFLKDNKFVDKYTKKPQRRSHKDNWREHILSSMIESGVLYSAVNKIYHGKIIRRYKLRFDEKKDFAEDTKFVLQYLACFDDDSRIKFCTEPLYIYNYGTVTSVVSKSSLIWQNWQASYGDVLRWISTDCEGRARAISKHEKALLESLRRRFKISHSFAVARSKMTRREKLKYLSLPKLLVAEMIVKIRG